MQKRDENENGKDGSLQSLGVCHRLYHFVMARLMAIRLRRMTLSSVEPPESINLLTDDSERKTPSSAALRSEITIHFKQTEESVEKGTSTNKLGSVSHEAEKEENPIPLVQENEEIPIPLVQENEEIPVPLVQENGLPNKVPKKAVSLKESVEDERDKKGKSIVTDDQHEHPKPKPQRHLRPLLNVATNINEKSDAFIRRRKEAMKRNYGLEQKK